MSAQSDARVTVISVFHDREGFVRESVESLRGQDEVPLRGILVDDCSTDGTRQALREVCPDGFELVENDVNLGFVTSMRIACAAASTPYIAVHGSGDISAPSRLRLQADLLDSDEEIVAVDCKVQHTNQLTGVVRTPTNHSAWGGRNRLARPTSLLLEQNLFAHGAVMFRRSAYLSVGGYRREFTYAQDRDLWLRLSEVGDFARVPEDLYSLMTLPGGVSGSFRKTADQIVLSHLARECAKQRAKGGRDVVDEFGFLALTKVQMPEAAARLRRHSAVALLAGQTDAASHALDLAAAFGPRWRNAPARAYTAPIARSRHLRSLGQRVMARRGGRRIRWDAMGE